MGEEGGVKWGEMLSVGGGGGDVKWRRRGRC